jgi:hypothetical protein
MQARESVAVGKGSLHIWVVLWEAYTGTLVLFVLTSVGCNMKLFVDMVTISMQAFV